VTETANFQPLFPTPAVRYAIELHATTAFGAGTAWTANVNGTPYASTTSWINVSGFLPGSYPLTVATATASNGLTQYVPADAPTHVAVGSKNAAVPLTYLTEYWVSVSVAGSGTVSPASGFTVAGQRLTLTATPGDGEVFRSWVGTGSGSYSGANATAVVTVEAPTTEVASFTSPTPGTTVPTTTPGFWSSSAAWALLAVVGLAAGLAIGLALFRGGRGGHAEAPGSAGTAPGRPSEQGNATRGSTDQWEEG
jgi:hypothetical protein